MNLSLRSELVYVGQIWTILLGFGPLYLDLGHFAYIWAILLGFKLFGRRQSPEDGAGGGRTYIRTDGQTDRPIPPVYYRTFSPLRLLPKN